jgi:uncharacterized Fe-S cluster-containing radical SAM superfamily enzyme
MPKFIKLIKELQKKGRVIPGIQNFLEYRHGKCPVKQMNWDVFRKKLGELEKKHNIKLVLDFKKDFKVHETKKLPKPFKKGQVIKARIMCPGHLKNEMIAAASGRAIPVVNCPAKKEIKLRITRAKHNIFYGVC